MTIGQGTGRDGSPSRPSAIAARSAIAPYLLAAAAADPQLAFVFKRPFAEQVAFFRGKLGNLVPTSTWRDLLRAQHDRAFMVAGAAKADLLADLAGAIDKAIADGEPIQAFRARFRDIVRTHGWHGWTGEGTKAGEAWRTRIIYETNLSTSYAAGRLAQLKAGNYPYWMYKHSDAVQRPRAQHLAWDGLVLPPDHDFWRTHYPPNGWGCFPAETTVRGDMLLGQRFHYRGEMVELHTQGGHRLTVTPNHPVLTARGWVAASKLQTGDQVIAATGQVHSSLHGIVDDPQAPAAAGELFESLSAQGLRIVPMSPDDFHGDATCGEGEIHIAGANRGLVDVLQPTSRKFLSEDGFQLTDHGGIETADITVSASLAALGFPDLVLAQDAADGGFCDLQTSRNLTVARHPCPIQRDDLAFDLGIAGIRDFPGSGKQFCGFPSGLYFDPAILRRFVAVTNGDMALLQEAEDSRTTTSLLFRQLLEANARHVTRDNIVSIHKFQWSGHVFDFSTRTGVMLAGGIVVSNCKCRVFGVRSPAQARRLGGDPEKDLPSGWNDRDRTGQLPGIDEGWDYQPGGTALDTIRALTPKLDQLPPQPSIALIQDWLRTDAFARWFENPVGAWPLVRLPEADVAAIGAQTAIGSLSAETIAKQKTAHPELTPREYSDAQRVVDAPTNHAQEGSDLIYIREEETTETGGYVLVVRATQSGKGVWVTSYRRLSRKQARRDSEIRRLLKKSEA